MYFGKIVKLRGIEESDLSAMMKDINEWQTRRTLSNQLPYSKTFEKKWIERVSVATPQGDGQVVFIIEEKKTSEYLGTLGIHGIDLQARRAELGISIWNKAQQGKGFGTDATMVGIWIAFHVINLHSLYLQVFDYNKRGIRAYEKAGFKVAGESREAAFVEGKYHNVILMDILHQEFMEKYPPGTFVGENTNK